jgi:predicted DCC family thiol-disulfide oxidoreductase YuxK
MELKHTIVLFDGICNLCNGSVNFLLKYDKKKQFRFLPLQDEKAKTLKTRLKIPDDIDSVVLISKEKVFTESDAIIEACKLLGFPWNSAAVTRLMPQRLRNKIYRWIGKNRYSWFGKRESCRIVELDGY